MFELRGISKQFGDVTAVETTDWSIATGKTTVIIGPSGCGKSTLLRLLIGLIEPDDGQVLFDGTALGDESMTEVRRRIGYVIQGGGLFPHLTARQNIELMPRHLGWPAERTDERLQHFVDMTHFPSQGLQRYPGELSGGQRQRVSLMRALILDPDAVLMDEPLGALDPLIRAELQDQLQSIFEDLDKTVITVTHDMDEAAFFGDDIALMRDGNILQVGGVRDLLESPADPFVSEFIGAQRSILADFERGDRT